MDFDHAFLEALRRSARRLERTTALCRHTFAAQCDFLLDGPFHHIAAPPPYATINRALADFDLLLRQWNDFLGIGGGQSEC